ncbi:response regulator transcription factor [Indiicoccus explosivorum]|uniref:response regulator transcription factor n=1 Tax=Indiicoccus explosivorum TaxID=1917864 RepID=UPI000B433FC8|nr:response regulator transcription factor [Indiicoccus explosivorum]
MKGRILIIEDDPHISRILELELQHEGYETRKYADGKDGLAAASDGSWDVILLDVMLPGLNGLEVLRRLRETDETPVILLTARGALPDKVSGLDLGANDYMTKPFEIEELLARIRVMQRAGQRTGTGSEDGLKTHGKLTVNERTREVNYGGQPIDLTRREYDLLVFFIEHPDQVFERDQILRHVWGYDYAGETNVVDVYVRYLRKKIEQPFSHPLIRTVRGVGYRLEESGR